MATDVQVDPLTPACGAVIRGVDPLAADDATFERILDAWHEHLVLFFPEQPVDPVRHQELAQRLGELEIHPHVPKVDDKVPAVAMVRSEDGGKADVWHTDVTYLPCPPTGCLAQYVSGPDLGGDTMWSNQYLAYDSLSEALKDLISGLSAVHTSTVTDEMTFEHPVVRTHPATGRPVLFVNRLFTRRFPQLQPGEGAGLLSQLLAAAERPELTCRWRWTPGDMALWDNRCTQHYAINDYEGPRLLHRAMIKGDTPIGPSPRWAPPATGESSLRTSYEARA